MRSGILAAFLGAVFALAPAPSAFIEPPDLDERIRQITEAPAHLVVDLYADSLLVFAVVLAALILVSGLDDAFVDAYYWLRRLGRRKVLIAKGADLEALRGRPESWFAIMVPAWKEHDVIAAMVENTVKTLDYRAYRIFCGVYRNDPATAAEVDRMVARYPDRVTRVDVPHDGPTCKADCLNHIARRVLTQERSSGTRFAGMVLHDSEDVIHPLELKLFNRLVPGKDLVQLPVFSLDRAWHELTAGTYIDDFAESHGKDMAVREALIGVVPGAGVATCYSANCMAALWNSTQGEPFNTASLTEDYDLSSRLARLGMSQSFAHVTVESGQSRAAGVRGRTRRVIATHEYFPDTFKAAYRQRARWVIGIAFQGWQQMGWRGSAWERYFLFRDRKAMVMAPACLAAYVLALNFVLGMAFGSEDLRNALLSVLSAPLLETVLALNLAFLANRVLQRAYFVGHYYGPAQALLSMVRTPVNNLINFCAVMRAWRLFLDHVVTKRKLAWDKTAHVYPDALALAGKPLGVLALSLGLLVLADQRALAAPPPLAGQAYELADEAYKAVESGQVEHAMRLASEALRHAPGHPSLLLLQADLLARQQRHAEALELIRALGPDDLGGVGLAQRGYLWLSLRNNAAAQADFVAALKAGGLDEQARANVSAELAYLAVKPPPTGRTHELADQAEALARQQRHAEALELIRALGPDDLGGVGLAQRGYLWLSLRNNAAAEADFVAAIKAGGLEPRARANVSSELAYLALARNDDAAALGWFRTALETSARAGVYADGGYAAMRLGRNRVAAELFANAVDEWHAAPPGSKPFDETALYGMRRSVDSLSRRWGAAFSIGHSSTQATAGSSLAPTGADLRVLQAGAEITYTPESFGYRDGRVFQLYANAFQAVSANDVDYATGGDSRVAGLGARYKPLRETNLVFALERRLALGERAGEDDWLLRLGWSASGGTDWNPVRSSWTAWQVYTESAYFTKAERLVQPFEARVGRSWKLPQWHGAVVTPYLGIGGEYDKAQSPRTAAGVGPGLALRYWFGESRHRAFAGYLDFSLQYRYRVTDAKRGEGLFGQLSLSF